ncbi:MAG: PEP-CTERM sorting domain-containing protein [Planctomycetaceae bacterium]|nr:PEP-CTERM sorting domain-containing protein [Planctomycetaceae bacterium]
MKWSAGAIIMLFVPMLWAEPSHAAGMFSSVGHAIGTWDPDHPGYVLVGGESRPVTLLGFWEYDPSDIRRSVFWALNDISGWGWGRGGGSGTGGWGGGAFGDQEYRPWEELPARSSYSQPSYYIEENPAINHSYFDIEEAPQVTADSFGIEEFPQPGGISDGFGLDESPLAADQTVTTAVPEPSAFALALASVAAFIRRRRKA